jgi:hypothetical protein
VSIILYSLTDNDMLSFCSTLAVTVFCPGALGFKSLEFLRKSGRLHICIDCVGVLDAWVKGA